MNGICTACREPVIRALTEARRWQLLNPAPDDAGNVAAYRDASYTWHARTLTGDQKAAPPEKRFMPHYATCAKRQKPSEPQPVPPGVVGLEQWKRARATHAKDKRRRGRRGGAAQQQYLGYRKPGRKP